MKLTDQEKAVLGGSEGPARQKAMEFIVNYGIALGADRLLDVDNVAFTTPCPYPADRHADQEFESYEAMFAYANLNSDETVDVPRVKVTCCSNHATNPNKDYLDYLGITDEKLEKGIAETNEFLKKVGVNNVLTCVPHLVGHLASKGEHIVVGESAAVVFLNSVFGARTNIEGDIVGGCAALVGKIPNAGLHLDENRLGTHLIKVNAVPKELYEWDLLGYYVGKRLGSGVAVFEMDIPFVSMDAHKSLSSAICTSGAVELYHIIGHTPEAATYDLAFGKNVPKEIVRYGETEKMKTLEMLNFAKDDGIDLVLLGCPNYSAYQLRSLAEMLRGKTLKTRLIVMTSWSLKDQAVRNGDAGIIEKAGGYILTDACPPMIGLWPENVKVMATDSAKMAHYTPSYRPDISVHMGSLLHCVDAALSGKW